MICSHPLLKSPRLCRCDAVVLLVWYQTLDLQVELHKLMLVSAPVSFLFFLCINICVVVFVQATSFNERNASGSLSSAITFIIL